MKSIIYETSATTKYGYPRNAHLLPNRKEAIKVEWVDALLRTTARVLARTVEGNRPASIEEQQRNRNRFMSSAKHAPTQPTDDRTSSAKTPALLHRLRGDSIGELLLNIGFFLSVVLCGALLVIYSLQLGANAVNLDVKTTVFVAFLLGLLAVDAAGCIAMIVFDYNTHLPQARMTARVTMVSLAATVVVGIAVTGLKPINLIYIFQFFRQVSGTHYCICWIRTNIYHSMIFYLFIFKEKRI